jgi:hypothetical protein
MALLCAAALLSQSGAQPPAKKGGKGPGKDKDSGGSALVERMMAFDKNKDGKLTKDEVTDERLHRLFDRADANKDGVVTREELEALAAQLEKEAGPGGERRGPGGPRGPGGFGGPPRPGQVLPPFLQERLNLTPEQKKRLDALQKEVDERLGKILTAEQKKQIEEIRGGFGAGGPRGRGPGGRPGE